MSIDNINGKYEEMTISAKKKETSCGEMSVGVNDGNHGVRKQALVMA
jgi:hypothetical protein